MRYKQLVAHFGGVTKTAEALDPTGKKLKKQAVNAWRERGRIPSRWQIKAAVLSRGALHPDEEARKEANDIAAFIIGVRA